MLNSEGERDAVINNAEGAKQRVVLESEAARQQQINEAEGEAQAILSIANATADGLRAIAASVSAPGGEDALRLRIAEQYVGEFGKLAQHGNTFVVPANMTDLASMITLATSMIKSDGAGSDESARGG